MRDALLAAGHPADRVDTCHLPVARWVLGQLGGGGPLVVGLQGPQGAGKSTLAGALVVALAAAGRRAVAVSVDDFYLTHAEQCALAAAHPGDRTLELRGYPGTHDVALGHAVLTQLCAGGRTRVPVYDKGAHGGRGDRRPEAEWRVVDGPWDVVLVEGWMLGFRPAPVPPALAGPAAALPAYEAWSSLLHAMILLTVDDPLRVVHWRVDAERARRARGEATLSDDEARDYVERFLPAYEVWVPGLLAHPPGRRVLRLALDADRRVRTIHAD